MASTIKLKNGSGAPLASDLVQGEPALDLTNKRLYTEDSLGNVIEVGTNPTSLTSGNITVTGTISASGEISANGGIALGDSDVATFGDGDDLQIYHDGSNSYISDQGTGNLKILANSFVLKDSTDTNNMVVGLQGDATKLFYNGSEKLATTNTGIDVTGTVTADGLTVDGSVDVNNSNLNITSTAVNVNLYESDTTDVNTRLRQSGGTFSVQTLGDTSGVTTRMSVSNATGDISFYEDTGTTAKFFWDASAESLGIGTTSPDTQLTTYKASTASDVEYIKMSMPSWGTSTNYFKSLVWDDSGNTVAGIGAAYDGSKTNIHFHSQYNSGFKTTSDVTMSIMGNGNVGIGTASPDSLTTLSTSGGNAILELKRDNANTSGAVGAINFTASDGHSVSSIYAQGDGDNEGAHLVFRTTSAAGQNDPYGANTFERMRIDSSGNVGIGTSSPATPLVISNSGAQGLEIDGYNASASATLLQAYNRSTSAFNAMELRASQLEFNIGASEAMRIDSSGNLLVGKTTTDAFTTVGTQIDADGFIAVTRDSSVTGIFNRETSDGDILQFRKDNLTVGSIGSRVGTYVYMGSTGGAVDAFMTWVEGTVRPANSDGSSNDNAMDFGIASARWDDIYATNGTIQTSDANEKQDIEALSEAEQRVAVAAKGLLRKFRWKDSVAEKGDDARIHFGIIAQDLQAVFEAEGLDAGRYAMFIHTTWTDEETGEERSRMGVRYSELLAFIIAAI